MSSMLGMRRPTVLVADDSPQNIELLSRILGQEYRVKVATSGAPLAPPWAPLTPLVLSPGAKTESKVVKSSDLWIL